MHIHIHMSCTYIYIYIYVCIYETYQNTFNERWLLKGSKKDVEVIANLDVYMYLTLCKPRMFAAVRFWVGVLFRPRCNLGRNQLTMRSCVFHHCQPGWVSRHVVWQVMHSLMS